MTKTLKFIAFIIIAIAVTSITGLAHFSYAKPAAESLMSFVFFSFETAVSHGIAGIVIALLLIFLIKKSIKMLFTVAVLLAIFSAGMWYIW